MRRSFNRCKRESGAKIVRKHGSKFVNSLKKETYIYKKE